MRLVGISLGAVLVAAMVWGIMWFWGGSQTYKPYDHPLMNWTHPEGQPLQALSTDDLDEAKDFLAKNPDGILYLNLKVSKDGLLFTTKPGALDFITKLQQENPNEYTGNKNFYYDFAYLKKHAPDLILVDDWITLKPKFWIFNIVDNAMDIDKHITIWFEKNNFADKAVITSDADIVISSLKDKNPLWIYGTSLSDLTKLLTMTSVKLQALVGFKRDYFITPVTLNNREAINPKLIIEMKKRFKKVAIGPITTNQELEIAKTQSPDILIITPKIK